jgi:hypothetical protein
MAHSHTYHDHDDVVVDRSAGFPAGVLVALALLLVVLIVGLAVLFSAPWDDDGGARNPQPNVPGINDGGGNPGGGGQSEGGTQPDSAPAR